MVDFPIATLKRIMKEAGCDRVSDEAAQAMSEELNEIGRQISHRALELMRYAKRKTVTEEDIRLAASE